jgi:hypothetical protein
MAGHDIYIIGLERQRLFVHGKCLVRVVRCVVEPSRHHVWLDLIRADVDRLEVCAFGFGRFFHLEEEVAQDDVKIRIPRIQLDGFFNLGLGSVNVPSAGVESDQFQARLNCRRIQINCMHQLGFGFIEFALTGVYPGQSHVGSGLRTVQFQNLFKDGGRLIQVFFQVIESGHQKQGLDIVGRLGKHRLYFFSGLSGFLPNM